jgi:membrane protein
MQNLSSILSWFGRQWSRRRIPGLAAEAAFWLFFALIPMAAVAGLIAARIARQRADVWLPFLEGAPVATRELVTTQLNHVSAWNTGTVGPVAAVMFLWLASSGLHALFDALQADLGRTRSWIRTRIAALFGCTVLAIGVAALVSGSIVLMRSSMVAHWLHDWKWASRVLGLVWAFIFARGLFRLGLSPRERQRLPLSAGAAISALLQTIVGGLYIYSLSLLGDGSAYLAGLASIGVTLTALFLYTLFLLIGLSLSQLLKRTSRCKRIAIIRGTHSSKDSKAFSSSPEFKA